MLLGSRRESLSFNTCSIKGLTYVVLDQQKQATSELTVKFSTQEQ